MTDPFIIPYLPIITQRQQYIKAQENRITDNGRMKLYDFADYHLFFGLHHVSEVSNNNSSLNSSKNSSNDHTCIQEFQSFNNCDKADYKSPESKDIGWIFREWAPNASAVYIIGTMTEWKVDERFRLFNKQISEEGSLSEFDGANNYKNKNSVWERSFHRDTFKHGDIYRLKIFWKNREKVSEGSVFEHIEKTTKENIEEGDRIPTCATRVVQDPQTLIFNAQVWLPDTKYKWEYPNHSCNSARLLNQNQNEPLLIYEAHTGMAQEEGKVGTYVEFKEKILPRVKEAGYNAIQLMAVQEHPYYASFGYHVSNFFAPSSRFGTPDDFKSLIDAAHRVGIKVIIDIVHSHAVINEVEGLSRFDGTLTQFFHEGERGYHKLWGSRCFDYSKRMVVKFLLSNCRYWLEEFNVDGFRFDGITSMLYKDHGIERAFISYADYFVSQVNHKSSEKRSNSEVDLDAMSYLYLANKLIHQIAPSAITIAEEVSGYPGLAVKEDNGGLGFDYRFAMGIADFWIKLLKEYSDEEWPLGQLWYELNARREDEKSISYSECHDQALVGDQTIMMRLMGAEIYCAMSYDHETANTFRGVALHKMIRLITLSTAGDGYLNFMGNEFGHPEWIDFPGEHNNWSFHYARRQWSLRDNEELYYALLAQFDKDMIALAKQHKFIRTQNLCIGIKDTEDNKAILLHIHEANRVLAFQRRIRYEANVVSIEGVSDNNYKCKQHKISYKNFVFVFNFNPLLSFNDYMIEAPSGKYQEIMNSDEIKYGGKGRLISGQIHFTHYIKDKMSGSKNMLSLYLPTRTAIVLSD